MYIEIEERTELLVQLDIFCVGQKFSEAISLHINRYI